ncbi:hypothetical protein B4915_06835 [Leucobacter massiliensis]|uniref:Lipid/polyisoprenoid-binding YceI-like domain-containing protein n=1 Tax=Leucobacter massiliensis TaxID=1686285 RepID=A0A2S9QPM3_9MICO|nr:hypothetical protein B4915_06835 [Leucobacter massiliensis]
MMRVRRSVRTIGVVATVSAALPLCLVGCAVTSDASHQAAELRAAVDSDVLELPETRTYDVVDTRLLAPLDSPALEALAGHLSSSGFMVLNDGVITEARYEVSAAGMPSAGFELTEPLVLRRAESEIGTLTATGTLFVDGTPHPGTTLRLTPTSLSVDSAEFDVAMSLPDQPLLASGGFPVDELSAHLTFVLR